jgi:hypothetical protein
MAVLELLVLPFAILNILAGLSGAIWLAILGKWWLLAMGAAGMVVSAMALGLVLMPGMLVSVLAAPFLGRRHWYLGFPFVLAGSIYSNAVVGLWCFLVVTVFIANAGDGATLPALLWAYAVAIAPLSYMMRKDDPDDRASPAMLVTFFAQIAVVAMGTITLLRGYDHQALFNACALTMAVVTLLQGVAAFVVMKNLPAPGTQAHHLEAAG